jgi:hypothetical protein
MKIRFLVVTILILAAALSRLIPHPYNFAPITAIALFGGANFSKKAWAFLIPLGALFISDLIIGFYPEMAVVYGTALVIVCMGFWVRKHRSVGSIAGATVAGSIFFFLTTNFAVWALQDIYPRTLQGLATCFTMALPFFRNTLTGDLFYTAVLFGALALAEKRFFALREPLQV